MEQDTQSNWNMADATMKRMDESLNICRESSRKGNGWVWYRELNILYNEVYPELTEKERDKAEELLGACLEFYNNNSNTPKNKTISITGPWRVALSLLERHLRDCMGKHNMYVPHKRDERLDL